MRRREATVSIRPANGRAHRLVILMEFRRVRERSIDSCLLTQNNDCSPIPSLMDTKRKKSRVKEASFRIYIKYRQAHL